MMKGELKCDFITHNLDEVTGFWRNVCQLKKGSKVNDFLDEPIPTFKFVTPQNVEPGFYWFIIERWLFTHCEVRVVGYTENTHCEVDTYICEKI